MSSSPPSSPSAEGPRPRRPTTAILRVLSGARSGHEEQLTADFATLGRHPSSDLPFDTHQDREVSARHAAVFRQGGGYVIRDLGSSNGTWVNGARIRSDHALEPGDRIQLGTRGPELEFQIVEVEHRPPVPATGGGEPEPAPPALPAREPALPARDEPTTDLRIRLEVARQTDRLRRRLMGVLALVAIVVLAAAGWIGWFTIRDRAERAVERDRLLRQVDSLQVVLMTAAEQATDLRTALDSAQQRAFQLRQSIAGRDLDAAALAAFDSQIAAAVDRNAPLLRAARFDVAAVTRANAPALAMVFAEFDSTRRVSATGFVARTRADTAWIVTSRHAVTDAAGQPPANLGVAFNGAAGIYRARFVVAHDSADVAVIRVVGRYSRAIAGVGATESLVAGEPVALLGYPMGLDLPMGGDWRKVGVSASTSTGTVSRVLEGMLQIDGYGASGASGSPIFDTEGNLVGVLFGGERESGGRIVYAAPVGPVLSLLNRVAPQPQTR